MSLKPSGLASPRAQMEAMVGDVAEFDKLPKGYDDQKEKVKAKWNREDERMERLVEIFKVLVEKHRGGILRLRWSLTRVLCWMFWILVRFSRENNEKCLGDC